MEDQNEKQTLKETVKNGDGGVTEGLEERMKALAEREAALERRERTARCRDALRERRLPEELAGYLDLADEKQEAACLEALEKAFNDAVAQRVHDRLGHEPPRASAGAPDGMAAVRRAMGLL